MKIRIGFISNSSSASFILDKRYITSDDIQKIRNFCSDVGENEGQCWDSWSVTETGDFLNCYTTMDNGYLFKWIKENLNIPLKAIVDYDGDGDG